jgi:Kdo2-lipid IVA lauroyltransferase/acyltransferase
LKFLAYILTLPFIYFTAFLPFKLLYAFSDFLYFILYKCFKYRVKVVRTNIKKSFPKLSETELLAIEKKFYSHLCDIIIETIKKLTISEKEVLKRAHFKNFDLLANYAKNNQSVITCMGHNGNWEWIGMSAAIQLLESNTPLFTLFKPMSNKNFEYLINEKIRKRGGLQLINQKDTLRHFAKNKENCTVTNFIADQTQAPEMALWITFLNQDTAAFDSFEKISKKYNQPVLYVSVSKPKRGYYELEFVELRKNDTALHFYELLEKDIMKQPEIWIWSHKRWKHKKPY